MTQGFERFEQWQRVKPIGVLYFADKFVRVLLANFYVFIPMFIGLRSSIERSPQLGSILTAGAVLLFVLYVLASYYAFQFRISDGRIEIRKGIFKRLRLNVPYDKVQDIKLEQPFYYRSSEMTVVIIDTAGSTKQEATLVALPSQDAEALKQILQSVIASSSLNEVGADKSQSNDSQSDSACESLLITRSLSDLVIHGITNNRVWIIIGALSPFIDDAINKIDDWLSFLNLTEYYSLEQQGVLLFTTILISTIFIFIALVTGFSIIGSIVTFHGYALYQSGDRLKRQSGLITRYQVNVKLSRIQHIVYQQDWLDGLFGRINLAFKQMNAQLQGVDANQRTLIVPSITQAQSILLGEKAFPHKNPFELSYTPISKRFILRYSLMLVLPISLLIAILSTLAILDKASLHTLWWLTVPVLLQIMIIMRWFRWGYFYDDQHVYIRKGLLGIDRNVYPLFKSQQSVYKQSLFLKRLALANIELSFASGLASIPCLPEDDAIDIIDTALFAAENTPQSWM